jgi:hypothetical protein
MDHPGYSAACAEYLALQIRIQTQTDRGARRPSAGLLRPLTGVPEFRIGQVQSAYFEENALKVLLVSHPYSDLGKSPAQRAAEGALLAEAWSTALHCGTCF